MNTPSQPPGDSLQRFVKLAQELREASRNRDYATLGRLLADNLQPDSLDVLIYVRTSIGTLTLIGSYSDFWNRSTSPTGLSREPTLEEMALVLQAARR
jgi:hypothetical protein